MTNARRRIPLPAILLAAFLLEAACTPAPDGGSGGAPGQASRAPSTSGNRLIIGIQQEPDKLNSALNAMVYGTYINQTIYGYFVKYDHEMNLIPDVLEKVPTVENGGISEDGLTYTYHLRDDVRWHDGTPFTAADIAFSVDVMLNTQHEIESRQGFDKIERLETPDEHTVVFHLKEVFVKFVEDMFFDEPIMPKHLLEEHVGLEFGQAQFHRAPVGLGPYRFKEWTSGSHVTVERNDDWFRDQERFDEITFRFIPDQNSMYVALGANEIDGYDNATTDAYERLQKMTGIQPHVTPGILWEHLDFNTEDPILADRRVRQAIQFAIDREQISREIYGGIWPAGHGDIPPTTKWYNPEVEKLVRHDPDAARALLEEAGWKPRGDGYRYKNGERLTLTISTTAGRPQRELTEQVIQQHVRDVGIELKIENYNATAFFAPFEDKGILKRGKYQIAMYAWSSSPDPDRFSLYHGSQVPPPDGQNHPRIKNARLDELIDRGLTTIDPTKRKVIYDEIQVIIATEVPMTPLIWRADIDPMAEWHVQFRPNPTQTGDTWNAGTWKRASM